MVGCLAGTHDVCNFGLGRFSWRVGTFGHSFMCGMVCFPFEFSHHFSSLIGVIVRAADFLESIVVQDCKTQALHHCTYRFVPVLLR